MSHELHHEHLPDPIDQVPVQMCIIGLVAIKKDGKWCATHETRGWYMPAGRVDYGEGIDTGAKREALEEGGVDVRLTDLLRIDFTPTKVMARCRAIYYAELINPDQPLRGKDQADNEIIEAVWVNPNELKDGRKIRTDEMIEIFEFLNKNPRLVPASFLSSTDGYPIDHKQVITKTYFSITAIIFDGIGRKKILTTSSGGRHDFPSYFMPAPTTFAKAAVGAFPDIQIIGFSKLRFLPPDSRVPERKYGHMNAVVIGVSKPVSKSQKFRRVSKVKLSEWNSILLQEALERKNVAPESIFDFEGAALRDLSADMEKIDQWYQ